MGHVTGAAARPAAVRVSRAARTGRRPRRLAHADALGSAEPRAQASRGRVARPRVPVSADRALLPASAFSLRPKAVCSRTFHEARAAASTFRSLGALRFHYRVQSTRHAMSRPRARCRDPRRVARRRPVGSVADSELSRRTAPRDARHVGDRARAPRYRAASEDRSTRHEHRVTRTTRVGPSLEDETEAKRQNLEGEANERTGTGDAREGRVRVRRGARAFCPTMVVGFIFNFLAWVERVWPSGCPTIDHACSLLASSDITLLESIAETLLQFVLGGLVSLPLLACFFPREKAQGTALLIPFLGENKI